MIASFSFNAFRMVLVVESVSVFKLAYRSAEKNLSRSEADMFSHDFNVRESYISRVTLT